VLAGTVASPAHAVFVFFFKLGDGGSDKEHNSAPGRKRCSTRPGEAATLAGGGEGTGARAGGRWIDFVNQRSLSVDFASVEPI